MNNYKNIISKNSEVTKKVIFILFAFALIFPQTLSAQYNVVAEREITICQDNVSPLNLNKVLGINLSPDAGNWYNASNEKVSNIFTLPASSKAGDVFSFYFLVEAEGLYCGLKKNDRYNVSILVKGMSKPVASVIVQPTCKIATGTITVTAPALENNEHYVVTGISPTVASQNNTTGIFSDLNPGTYTVQVENTLTNCISESLTLVVNERSNICPVEVNDSPTGPDYVRISFDPNEGGNLTPKEDSGTVVSADGKIYIDVKIGTDYAEVLAIVPVATKPDYTFTVWNPTIPFGEVSTTSDKDFIANYEIKYTSLTIPELVTPNGDGVGDEFRILGLKELYPNFSLEIYNRYGNIVYNYKHNGDKTSPVLWWKGYSTGKRNFGNSKLPVGVYFYIIYFNDGKREPQDGWVYLRYQR